MLRHLIVRKGRTTGEIMVVLVTRKKKFPQKDAVIELIKRVVPDVTSIMQNVNIRKRTSFSAMKRFYCTENQSSSIQSATSISKYLRVPSTK